MKFVPSFCTRKKKSKDRLLFKDETGHVSFEMANLDGFADYYDDSFLLDGLSHPTMFWKNHRGLVEATSRI